MKRSINPALLADVPQWAPQPMQQAQQAVEKAASEPADEPKADDPDGKEGEGFKSEHSKQSVLADLARERAERQALQNDMTALKSSLAEAFGIKPDPTDDSNALLTGLQKQFQQMQHESSVLRLANQHRITDEDDLKLLASATDAEAMKGLAARLAPSEPDSATPGSPKPDLTQGGKGDPAKPDPGPGVPRMAQAFDDAINQ